MKCNKCAIRRGLFTGCMARLFRRFECQELENVGKACIVFRVLIDITWTAGIESRERPAPQTERLLVDVGRVHSLILEAGHR